MTDIFHTYDAASRMPIIAPPNSMVDIPEQYESGLLYEIEKPATPFIISSSKFHDTKHPIIQSTDGYMPHLSGNGKPGDLYVESAPEFVKSYNNDLLSNYMLDLQQNTYVDGTRLGYIDPAQVHKHSSVIGIHKQERKPAIEPLDPFDMLEELQGIDKRPARTSEDLIRVYEEISSKTGRLPIAVGADIMGNIQEDVFDDFKTPQMPETRPEPRRSMPEKKIDPEMKAEIEQKMEVLETSDDMSREALERMSQEQLVKTIKMINAKDNKRLRYNKRSKEELIDTLMRYKQKN